MKHLGSFFPGFLFWPDGLGAGLSIEPKDNISIFLDYTTQLFREDLDAHYGSVTASLRF